MPVIERYGQQICQLKFNCAANWCARGILTGNQVAGQPCEVVVANPAKEWEETVKVVTDLGQRRGDLLEVFPDGGLLLDVEVVGVVEVGDISLGTARVNAKELGDTSARVLLLGGHDLRLGRGRPTEDGDGSLRDGRRRGQGRRGWTLVTVSLFRRRGWRYAVRSVWQSGRPA